MKRQAKKTEDGEQTYVLVCEECDLCLNGEPVVCVDGLEAFGLLPFAVGQGASVRVTVRRTQAPGFTCVNLRSSMSGCAAQGTIGGLPADRLIFEDLFTIIPDGGPCWVRLEPIQLTQP